MKIHFISGLPRSGSTLLAAILRQNPRFRAAMSGPLHTLLWGALRAAGQANEFHVFMSDEVRERVTRAIVEAYYADDIANHLTVFDTNRGWCGSLPLVARLFDQAKVICCLRSPAWILDSAERYVQQNPFYASKMIGKGPMTSIYDRVEAMRKGGFLGAPMKALREAWYGDYASRLIGVRFESLTERPAETIAALYQLLDEPPFTHDFEHLDYDAPEFDEPLDKPGLHRVSGAVTPRIRETVLPPELFRLNDYRFWDLVNENPRQVRIV